MILAPLKKISPKIMLPGSKTSAMRPGLRKTGGQKRRPR